MAFNAVAYSFALLLLGAGPREPNYRAGPPDRSHWVEQRHPTVSVSRAEASPPLTLIRPPDTFPEPVDHEVLPNPFLKPGPVVVDPVRQRDFPVRSMPTTLRSFLAQGKTNTAASVTGTPPDTNGAVGPNHFVQAVNGGYAIWDKSGNVVLASVLTGSLWTNYTGTNSGNSCSTHNDGDPVVVYDQLADRWFITQFSLPNQNRGPNFQCVAVSKTNDPTGAYWLYDFQYPGLNDYGKFGLWPDGYYATFNMFNSSGGNADLCVYDRASMLQGLPAAQQCFQQTGTYFGALPVSLEGPIAPARGTPGFFLSLDTGNAALDLWTLHVDWQNTANTVLSGPTTIPVAAFTPACNGTTCIPQGPGGSQVDSLADRLMFRLTYRNFGSHDALAVNHAVTAGGGSGLRWYEIRSPGTAPVVFQQGTYAPTDQNYRWMGSLAQDQAQDFALGFSISSTTVVPGIGWTGRLGADPAGTMGQGEAIFQTGGGTESGASRWGDYSNMTVDPADDCTFWYTQELYGSGAANYKDWDTYIASVKFPNCGANTFSLSISPASTTVSPGGQTAVRVTTAVTAGTAESIQLAVQDLPAGVTAAFSPASVTAGATSTLTLAAPPGTALAAAAPYTVIGAAASAVRSATAQLGVAPGPSVAITSPATGTTVSGPVTFSATATPVSGTTLASFTLAIDGQTVANGTASPLSYAWNTAAVPNGTHTLVASATDSASGNGSATVAVTVLTPPALELTPDGGTRVAGAVALRATAAPASGTTLSQLTLGIDGTTVQSATSSPVSFAWDSTAVPNGAHAVAAHASDADLGTAVINETLTVANPPTVTVAASAASPLKGKLQIDATATAPLGTTLTGVSINVDGTSIASGAASPLSTSWDSATVPDGLHVITATATDQDGTTGTSTSVTVTTSNGVGLVGGCACGTRGGALPWALLLGALLWRRRTTT